MAARLKLVYLTGFFLHFLLILSVSCRDSLWLLATSGNLFPRSFEKYWRSGGAIASAAVGEQLAASNPVRQTVAAYTYSSGIAAGYAFFAPNVPNSYKLVFELHYPGGRVEYALPQVGGTATGLRLSNLFDNIGRRSYGPLRELMLKLLAYSVWREHQDATTIRAVFGIVHLPTIEAFERGKKESYEFLYAYDFQFHS